jgi:hypothetical protein
MFRIDRSVSLPLGKLRESALPSLGEVMAAIEAALSKNMKRAKPC